MIPATFDYVAPRSLEEALALLQEHGEDARVLSGGHSLLPLMKLRLARPSLVVDLRRLGELERIERHNGSLRIGAAATHDAVQNAKDVAATSRLLVETAASIGDLQVRNLGTIGGSVVHADPAADWPAALLCAGATMVIASRSGQRRVAAGDFFRGMMQSAVSVGEILVAIEVQDPGPHGGCYLKIAQSASGFALAGVAAMITLEGDRVGEARIAVTGVAETPYRAAAVETALKGAPPDTDAIRDAAEDAAAGVTPLEDLHASAAFRAHLARVLARRALTVAAERARGTSA